MNPDDFLAPIGEGGHMAEQWLTLAAVAVGDVALVSLVVWAVLYLRPRPDRWAWAGAAATVGMVAYLLFYVFMAGL